jgi:hypothetical protein
MDLKRPSRSRETFPLMKVYNMFLFEGAATLGRVKRTSRVDFAHFVPVTPVSTPPLS